MKPGRMAAQRSSKRFLAAATTWRPEPKSESPEEAARHREIAARRRTPPYGARWSGLRLAESLELYWDRRDRLCVDLSGRRPMPIPAELKGNKDRLLPITPEFAEFLLATPEEDRHRRVFRPLPARGLNSPRPRWVSLIVSRIGKAANVKAERSLAPIARRARRSPMCEVRLGSRPPAIFSGNGGPSG